MLNTLLDNHHVTDINVKKKNEIKIILIFYLFSHQCYSSWYITGRPNMVPTQKILMTLSSPWNLLVVWLIVRLWKTFQEIHQEYHSRKNSRKNENIFCNLHHLALLNMALSCQSFTQYFQKWSIHNHLLRWINQFCLKV